MGSFGHADLVGKRVALATSRPDRRRTTRMGWLEISAPWLEHDGDSAAFGSMTDGELIVRAVETDAQYCSPSAK